MPDDASGLELRTFSKLYVEPRFKRHFGKARAELEAAKTFSERRAAAAAARGSSVSKRARPLRGALRVGNAASAVEVSFAEEGTLGIEWDAAVLLPRVDYKKEVMCMAGVEHSVPPRSGGGGGGGGGAEFVAAAKFEGARAGFSFRQGAAGLGYYSDDAAPTGGVAAADDEGSDDEIEYGCRIDAIQDETPAAQEPQLTPGLTLSAVNGATVEGMDTDAIIDMITAHRRSAADPLVLRLMPQRPSRAATAGAGGGAAPSTRVRWADEAAEQGEPEVDDDMFAPIQKRQKTLVRHADGTPGGGSAKKKADSVPFHVRVQQELAEYAETLKQDKAKKAKLENIQTIRNRGDVDELEPDEPPAPSEAEAAAATSAGPKIWGLKREKNLQVTAGLTWGGARV
eukprot:SAG11_NODE_2573_length_3208_cov_1.516565_1_plen_398_part_00